MTIVETRETIDFFSMRIVTILETRLDNAIYYIKDDVDNTTYKKLAILKLNFRTSGYNQFLEKQGNVDRLKKATIDFDKMLDSLEDSIHSDKFESIKKEFTELSFLYSQVTPFVQLANSTLHILMNWRKVFFTNYKRENYLEILDEMYKTSDCSKEYVVEILSSFAKALEDFSDEHFHYKGTTKAKEAFEEGMNTAYDMIAQLDVMALLD